MKESNLSPPVLAKNKGTVVFRLVPLQGEVSESVPRLQTYYALERISSIVTVHPFVGARLATVHPVSIPILHPIVSIYPLK